jgi:probable rRNA maturation factor
MPVEVQVASRARLPAVAAIERWGERALQCAPLQAPQRQSTRPASDGDVCIRVVDAAESRQLNHDYRHKDAPTNVLSFPAGIDLPDALVWGDIVVCADVVEREAADQGKRFEDHFAHMVVHGVLHLLGYDHQAADEAAVMERLEIQILDGFGISDPYGEG